MDYDLWLESVYQDKYVDDEALTPERIEQIKEDIENE